MTLKKRYIALITILGISIGWLSLGGTAIVMNYTSSTEFCVSCEQFPKYVDISAVYFVKRKLFS